MTDWRTIDTAPLGDDDFYLVCCADPRDDRSPFVVRGSIFASARKHPVEHHLSLAYLTHWMPLPGKPHYPYFEDNCPGHVASDGNPKICRRCGIHIDSLRPDESQP